MTIIFITLLSGIFSGILSGLLGLGGGVILIPIMLFVLNMSQHTAQGISLIVIIPTALVGVWQLHKAKLVNYPLAFYLALGSISGALISANFVQYIPADNLKLLFGIFIICIGCKILWETNKKIDK